MIKKYIVIRCLISFYDLEKNHLFFGAVYVKIGDKTTRVCHW